MEAPDPLAQYFVATQRYSPALGGRDGTRGQVDAILNELRIPCTLDRDGDWQFQTDVGGMLLLVESDTGDLVLFQRIEEVEKKASKSADLMHLLLILNFEARGAAYSSVRQGEKFLLALTSRMPGAEVGRDSVLRMLLDSLHLSRRLDQALGKETPGASPAAAQPGSFAAEQAGAQAAVQAGGDGFAAQAGGQAGQAGGQAGQASGQAGQAGQLPGQQGPPPAGWYPDPQGGGGQRWWDGQQWTPHTHP